jgi:putative ATPase
MDDEGPRPDPVEPAPLRGPLADRMRPRSLDAIVGQDALVGPQGALRHLLRADSLPSLLLWGPPGSGKTTLAGLLAAEIGAEFSALSSVSVGVAEVRAVIAKARELRARGGRLLLFLDEIHHFNKSQQDALLPAVEDGAIILVGATTENPYAALNAALLSRLRIFRLAALDEDALAVIVERALASPRGLAGRFALDELARTALFEVGAGDARTVLETLSAAAAIAAGESAFAAGEGDFGALEEHLSAAGEGRAAEPANGATLLIDRAAVIAAAQRPGLAYDASGTLSAFIKSIRGNDPDAALWWLATMLEAGKDPREIARRLVISAGEEIGSADPRALPVAAAALTAAEQVGMPEIIYPLAAATVILAGLPKSPRAGQAYLAVLEELRAHGGHPVPGHLRASAREYRRPNEAPDFDLNQQYLPDALRGRHFYEPAESGLESQIAARLARLAERRTGPKSSSR